MSKPDFGTFDQDVQALCEAVLASGLPEAEEAFDLGDGITLSAAWPDVRIGIVAAGATPATPAGWVVRPAAEWTPRNLVDAIRGGV